MNFLAHLHLSGDRPLVIVGNFMADGVKGRDLSAWHPALQKGIRMHRLIDSFTDAHPMAARGRQRLHAHCGHYAGVALDLFYDHVLANRWPQWHAEPLEQFTRRMYGLLQEHAQLMPERARFMLHHMVAQDWLNSYANLEGIGKALSGMARRTDAGARLEGAETILERHLEEYTTECSALLPELRNRLAHAETDA